MRERQVTLKKGVNTARGLARYPPPTGSVRGCTGFKSEASSARVCGARP